MYHMANLHVLELDGYDTYFCSILCDFLTLDILRGSEDSAQLVEARLDPWGGILIIFYSCPLDIIVHTLT